MGSNPNFNPNFNPNLPNIGNIPKLPFMPNVNINMPNFPMPMHLGGLPPLLPNVNFPMPFNGMNNDIDKFDNKKNFVHNNNNRNNPNNFHNNQPHSHNNNNHNSHSNNTMNNNLRPPNYKTKPCRNFHSDVGCNREDKCHFIHDLNYAGNSYYRLY